MIGKWLVEQIVTEGAVKKQNGIKKVIGIYPGRFQPMGKHHAQTYEEMARMGFDEVWVVTSDKVEIPKSPFSYQEKAKIIKSHGIRNVIKVKNPYKAEELLSKFDPETTAAVFMLGKKDADRLSGGKHFSKWQGTAETGYRDGAYVYTAKHKSLNVPGYGEMSGTKIRKALGDKEIDDKMRKKLYKGIFGHTKNYKTVTSKLIKLNEVMQSFLSSINISGIINEGSTTSAPGKQMVDDGPALQFTTFKGYENTGEFYAQQMGWSVVDYILDGAIEFKPDPDREIHSVSYFPAGQAGVITPINRDDIKGTQAWKKYVKRISQIALRLGYVFVDFMGAETSVETSKKEPNKPDKELQKISKLVDKQRKKDTEVELPDTKVNEQALTKEWWASIMEDITVPINVGDTVLMGKFKNKRVVVKSITKNEKGDYLINGKPAFKFRLLPKVDESIEEDVPKDVIDSFDIHSELNPKLWNGVELKPEIREKLLAIAKDFYSSLDISSDVKLDDITLTGSIANYNWSKFSDVDLHLRIDFSQIDDDTQFVKNYFLDKKSLWNQKHDIKIFGFPVEVYVENIGDVHIASGLYSILKDKWITEPPKKKAIIDKDDIKLKAEGYLAQEKLLKKLMEEKRYDEVIEMVDKIKARLKDMRSSGLEKSGEYGVENLAFKVLRRTPFLQTITDLKTAAYDEKMSMKEGLITEGGAYGHMSHPFDDRGMTFGDFKNLINLGLQGRLDVEEAASEKTDGQNLMVTWKDGKLKAARNKSTIKKPMDIKQMKTKFAGRGNIEKAFVYSMKDLEKAISSLSDAQKEKIFKGGSAFMNLEIIYPDSENIISYDVARLQFHGAIEYDLATATAIGAVPDSGRMLTGMITQINKNVQKTFKIIPPQIIKMKAHHDFAERKSYYIAKLNKLQKQFNLKDTSTMAEYHQAWWENYIGKKFRSIDNTIKIGLVKRWAFNDKSFRLNSKNISDKDLLSKIQKEDKVKVTAQVKKNMLPFETLMFELGADILKNAENLLAANPAQSVQNIRKKIASSISAVRRGGDLNKLKKVKDNLAKVQSAGGFENIVPTEGIVIKYAGKTYKITGIFGPVNQIINALW